MKARSLLTRAMRSPDDTVVQLRYMDSKGQATIRVVSPIRFLAPDRFLGLCLCRCEPRQFHIARCDNIQLKPAADYVMPVPMATAG